MRPRVVVTGASRGIGLEHCQQYAAQNWEVIACARTIDSPALRTLVARYPQQVGVHPLDVTQQPHLGSLVERLEGQPVDLLINNAGTFGPRGSPEGMRYQSLESMDYGIWRSILEVNLLAPFRITVALAPMVRRSRRGTVVMMSSDLGSIANNSVGHSHAYRSSKAALNMLTRGIAAEWKDVIVVSMAPGWTRTELGGNDAPLEPADSVRDQQRTIGQLTLADSGRFLDRFGQDVPW